MQNQGKSDTNIVAEKRANCLPPEAAQESVERRTVPKGKARDCAEHRTQCRVRPAEALTRIRQAAARDTREQFTALWHHVYNVDRLRDVFQHLPRNKATGIDQLTCQAYEVDLEQNLHRLAERLQRGTYVAQPVRRAYIPKTDGTPRPLGIPALEDKIVQAPLTAVLQEIYEVDFMDCSFGYRPGRSVHQALDTLAVTIEQRKVNWVFEVDIRAFFDSIDHECLMKCLACRIADQRVLRQIHNWLTAGVLEDGEWHEVEAGTPQGGNISPLLANIYLHYAFDQWADDWRQHHARGYMAVIRYADDFVVCFQYEEDARRFWQALADRLARARLTLHPAKTRLLEFGRFAASNRRQRGHGKPETFTFLGMVHICSTNRQGGFVVLRQSSPKKVRAKLQELKEKLRKRRHQSVAQVGRWLRKVLNGHYQHYGVPRNSQALDSFRSAVTKLWKQALDRRSDRGELCWQAMHGIAKRYLPKPRITQPYPNQRCRPVTT
jgi:RNA-directed DNA polymerase